MRNLTRQEIEILEKKERRMGRNLPVTGIEYRKAFPRTTVCVLLYGANDDMEIGVSMRAKGEPDIPSIGEIVSFTRAP